MKKIILDLCGGSGAWSKPYKDNGYDVRLITLPEHNVFDYTPPEEVYGILAAPPCEEFSIAKDHKLTRDLNKGLEVVFQCIRIIERAQPTFFAIENPIGLLSNYMGKPNYAFQPWWFGDPWTKRTALWGNFNEPIKGYNNWDDVPKIDELYIRPNRKKPGIAFLHKSAKKYIKSFDCFEVKTDADFRSITPQGFARAFYNVNK